MHFNGGCAKCNAPGGLFSGTGIRLSGCAVATAGHGPRSAVGLCRFLRALRRAAHEAPVVTCPGRPAG